MKDKIIEHRLTAMLFASFLVSPILAYSSEKYINVEIEGSISPALRNAISKVVEPSSLETTISLSSSHAVPLTELCVQYNCPSFEETLVGGRQESVRLPKNLDQELRAHPEISRYRNPNAGINIPSIVLPKVEVGHPGKQTYLLFSATDPLFKKYANNSRLTTNGPNEQVAIPIESNRLVQGIQQGELIDLHPAVQAEVPLVAATWFGQSSNEASSKIDSDLTLFGNSNRQFKVSPDAIEEDIQHLIHLSTTPHSRFSVTTSNKPENQFELTQSAVVFEADNEECGENIEGWPYNIEEVATTLEFNKKVLEQTGIRHPHRSNILVIDNGIGKNLILNGILDKFLHLHSGEHLYPNTFKVSLIDGDIGCFNIDSSTVPANAIGFYPNSGRDCENLSAYDRLNPVPKLEGDRLPIYNPAHGSFVAGLALGGPELIEEVGWLDKHIGITLAKVTKQPEFGNQTQSIRTEVKDLQQAIVFARERGVDIINASFKTSKRSFRNELELELEKFSGLVVAAAGNTPIELTEDSAVFPAAITSALRESERLIVVAATQPNSDTRLWSNSAFSKDLVDIAAPGAKLVSFDENGKLVCMSGTSAAAPLVTFTAALLKSMGLAFDREVKRRLLATAFIDQKLKSEKKIAGGRILDVNSALDVFVDQIWFGAETKPVRALIVDPNEGNSDSVLLSLCTPRSGVLTTAGGFADVAALVMWRRLESSEEVEIWHRLNNKMSQMNKTCTSPDEAEISFIDLAADKDKVVARKMGEISRIVPSPLRGAILNARAIATADLN